MPLVGGRERIESAEDRLSCPQPPLFGDGVRCRPIVRPHERRDRADLIGGCRPGGYGIQLSRRRYQRARGSRGTG